MNADDSQPDVAPDREEGQADSDDPENARTQSDGEHRLRDEGPGWMPAILAGTLLMGIIGFIGCGLTTWLLFQKRSELALRTVRGSYIPEVSQSRLEPDEKRQVVQYLEKFADGLERGDYENWQAAGVMQRLVRLPVIQWGELRAIEAYVRQSDDDDSNAALINLSRLQRAVELGEATSIDLEDVLSPALEPDDSPLGRRLTDPLSDAIVDDVIGRARLVADRSNVPNQRFDQVSIAKLVQAEIDIGLTEGGF